MGANETQVYGAHQFLIVNSMVQPLCQDSWKRKIVEFSFSCNLVPIVLHNMVYLLTLLWIMEL